MTQKRKLNKKNLLKLLLVIFLIVAGIGYWLFNHYFVLPVDEEGDEKSELAKQLGEYTVVILGIDSPQGYRTRTDTIMLATVDAENEKAQLLSIPRDSRVKIKGSWDKINAAYVYGGIDLTKEIVQDLLQIEVDRYVILNFNSVIHLVDAVGGIDVDVPVRMYKPTEGINLQPGKQTLDGKKALAYMRFRGTAEGDIGRAKRQQEILKLLADKVVGIDGIKNLPQLIDILMENVETDIPRKEIGALAKLAPDILKNEIDSIILPGKNEKVDGLWYYLPDIEQLEKQLLQETNNEKRK